MPVPILNTSNPVNRGHPLARGLVHWWKPLPHNWGGNVLYDIVGGNHATKNGTVTLWNGHNAGGNQPGSSIGNWTNSSNYYSFADVSFSEYTVIAWCRETAFPGTYGFIIGGIAGASQSRLGVLSTTSFGARFFTSGTNQGPTSGTRVLNVWAQFAYTALSGTSGLAYYNVTKTTDTPTSVTGVCNFSRIGSEANQWRGDIAEVKIFNRKLSDQEVYQQYYEALQGYPNLLNWTTPKAWLFGSAVQNGAFARQLITNNIPGMNQWKPQRSR